MIGIEVASASTAIATTALEIGAINNVTAGRPANLI